MLIRSSNKPYFIADLQSKTIMQVKMYTKENCSFCYAAKRLLTMRGIPYQEILLGSEDTKECEMLELTGGDSVPQILIDGKAIGGYMELVDMDMEGELEQDK